MLMLLRILITMWWKIIKSQASAAFNEKTCVA